MKARAGYAACVLLLLLCPGCDDDVGLEDLIPEVSIGQDWDDDGTVEPLPGDQLVDFGQVVLMQKSTRAVVIANAASATSPLSWNPETGIRLGQGSGAEGPFFLEQPPVAELAPGQVTALVVNYIPAEEGVHTGTVIIETNDPKNPSLTVNLRGEGVNTDIQVCLLDPDTQAETCNDAQELAIDFGLRDLGDTESRTLVVRNVGAFALQVASSTAKEGVDFGVGTSGEFALDPEPWSGMLEAGESKEFTVSYTPDDGGADEGTLEVTSDDPDEPLVVIDLSGNGLAPKICPQLPLSVDFGSIQVDTSARRSYQFTSCGNQVLTVTGLEIDSGTHGFFGFTSQITTPVDLAPGDTFDVDMTYAPTTEGLHTGTMYVTSNDPNAGEGWIELMGRATPIPMCDIQVFPLALNFGAVSIGGFSNQTVSMTNVGDIDCVISEIRGPDGSAEFSLPTVPELPLEIPPGESRVFAVRYDPVGEDSDQATVTVVCDNDPDSNETEVTLSGQGVQPPPCDIQVNPALLSFGMVPVGGQAEMTATIWNFGSEDCFITDWALTAGSDHSYTPSTVPFPRPQLAQNESIDVVVTFEPLSGGLLSATLEIQGSENNPFFGTPMAWVSMTGAGEGARMCLDPVVLDYGPVADGDHNDLTFDIIACGSGNLRIREIGLWGSNPDFRMITAPVVPFDLPAGQSQSVTVRYQPSGPGEDFGRVLVSGNADTNPTGTVELVGNYTGDCPSVFVCQPDRLNFPATQIGMTSNLAITCANLGSEALTVNDVSLASQTSAEYRIYTPVIPWQLQAGEEMRIEAAYTPIDEGVDTGAIELSSQFSTPACDHFTLIAVPLTAEGIAPEIPDCIEPRVFQPVLEFAWPDGNISNPSFSQVFMTPIVINLTDDNGDGNVDEGDIPDIVFNSFAYTGPMGVQEPAMIRAISGDDGHEIWTVDEAQFRTNYETQLAAGDIDGDNRPEILASKLVVAPGGGLDGKFVSGNILCFEHDGSYKWESEAWHVPEGDLEDGSSIAIADLDHDGHPEIIRGAAVFDNHGRLLWEGSAGRGSNDHGSFSQAVDLDNQGDMEILAGNTAYRSNGTVMWSSTHPDGLVGVADFDLDDLPEVLLLSKKGPGQGVYLLNGQTGADISLVSSSYNIKGTLPPVIADLDGDGGPEVGIIGECEGRMCFYGLDIDETSLSIGVLWSQPINDSTLGGGGSAFDFEGDGPFEILQNDETHVNAYEGLYLNPIYQATRTSVTGWELPVIADVDNDNHAEIIVIQNGGGVSQGILVYGNVDNDWASTRRIWNQFSYHITNVHENGLIPAYETPNWMFHNNQLANQPFCVMP